MMEMKYTSKMRYWLNLLFLVEIVFVLGVIPAESSDHYLNSTYAADFRRRLQDPYCDSSTKSNSVFQKYFDEMRSIYKGKQDGTCLPVHMSCGWPATPQNSKLPMLVLSVGLEGAGHHLWTEILEQPVFDCVWINARHYHRDIADGVPRTTVAKLAEGFREQFQLREKSGKSPCRKIYDAEDSFPTGAIRKSGRVFMRPDLVNLQQLDGKLFNIKYLIIIRNSTDTALSALRRNFFSDVDSELRTVEHTLTYIEAALRGVPCHRMFIAHYEHALANPSAFTEPLAAFLELSPKAKKALDSRLRKEGSVPKRKPHKLTQFRECAGLKEKECYLKVSKLLDDFFIARNFMWPTFAGNGFDFNAV